ncbi:MAG: hypothetical protein AAF333_00100 [Planctomycetota bacterium]
MNSRPLNVPLWLWMVLLGAVTVGSFSVTSTTVWADDHEHREHDDDHDDDEDWDELEEEMEWFLMEVEMYSELLDVVAQVHEIAADPDVSGVAAVLAVEEHTDGPAAAAGFLEGLLPEARSDTVRRAIRLQLVDFYTESDQPEKSQEQLRLLIAGEPTVQ